MSSRKNSDIRIVYMGTPDFAARPLSAIVEAGFSVELVVAQPDKPNGRGKKLRPGPVKKAAEAAGLPVAQPERIRDNEEFLDALRAIDPDLIVVAAYGKILPPALLDIPKYGCVNIHGSLLPRFRGAAPVQRCIMAGDETTGVTLMYMAEGLDTGDMIAKASTAVGAKNAGELLDELSALGADLIVEWIPKLVAGEAERTPQTEEEACYAAMLDKAEGRIDFGRPAEEIERQIRGFSPSPGAFTELEGQRMKVHRAAVVPGKAGAGDAAAADGKAPGTVIEASGDGLLVACGQDALRLQEIQMPGKRAMPVADFLRGHKVEPGTVLG